MKAFVKDPSERLDYTFDLTRQMTLDSDTIASHTVTLPTTPTGLDMDLNQHTTTTVVAWLKAGTAGSDYPVVFRAVTTGGREYERTFVIRVRNR